MCFLERKKKKIPNTVHFTCHLKPQSYSDHHYHQQRRVLELVDVRVN